MTQATIPAKSQKDQDKARARAENFYAMTVEQNNERLNQNVTDFGKLLAEVKFIESQMLTRWS
jgi:hypothetical protein